MVATVLVVGAALLLTTLRNMQRVDPGFSADRVELFTIDPATGARQRHLLGIALGQLKPEHVVPATTWQAARTSGRYTLVGCIVGPGFEFADMELLRDVPESATSINRSHPDIAPFV